MQLLPGETSDVSILMQFTFWEDVFNTHVNSSFPSESTEERGYFVGFAPSVGDLMTFQVLSKTTQKIIYWSNVRSAVTSGCPNSRLSTDGGLDKEDYLSDKYRLNPLFSRHTIISLPPLPHYRQYFQVFNPVILLGVPFWILRVKMVLSIGYGLRRLLLITLIM
jgi:hypothetical protein